MPLLLLLLSPLLLLLLLLALAPLAPSLRPRERALVVPSAGRGPPSGVPASFSDQSSYVGLSTSGALVAVADFNNDRFSDLLMLHAKSLRRVSVMQWDHHSYSFRHVGQRVDLDALPLAKQLSPPFRRISAAFAADFGNDGRMDILLLDGSQGIILFGDGHANFNASPPVHVPHVPRVSAVVDADGDLVPELFVAFDNGTRGFYKYQRAVSVQRDRFDQRGSVRFQRWDARTSCDGDGGGGSGGGAAARVPDAQSVAFADVDGDCLPDLVLGTACGLEAWSNRAAERTAFWELSAEQSHARLFNRSVFDSDGGDHAMVVGDFNADGAMDVGVANRRRRDLRVYLNQGRRAWRLCERSEGWGWGEPATQAVGGNELTLKDGRLGSLFGAIAVGASLRVGDVDLDGWADVLTVDAATGQPVVFRNERRWEGGRGRLRRLEGAAGRALGRGRGSAAAVGWLDTDESGRQDVVVVRGNETRLLWNGDVGGERMFFKGTVLSALGFRLRPRPLAPVAGNTIELSYAERGGGRRRRRRVCSQGGGVWSLAGGGCVFGLGAIANYVEELGVGGGRASRTWANLMPNSMAVVWAAGGGGGGGDGDGDGDGDGGADEAGGDDGDSWWMEYFTQRRGGPMVRVVGALLAALGALAVAIGALQRAERKRDRADAALERERLWGFA